MSNPFEDIQSIVAYRPQLDDVLFLLHPMRLSLDAMAGMKRSWQEAVKGTALEGVRIMILQEGMRPEVVRAQGGLTLDARQMERWRGERPGKEAPPQTDVSKQGEGGTQGATPTPSITPRDDA